jgi:hypothetical protein
LLIEKLLYSIYFDKTVSKSKKRGNMYWVIILGLALMAFILFKMNHMRHQFFLIALILLLLFFYITVTKVIKDNDLNLNSISGVETTFKLYFVWLGGAFDNMKAITGNAVKMDWSMKNKTNEVKINEIEK